MTRVVTIPMTEVEECLMCGKHIGKGNDPAVCGKDYCKYWLKVELDFESWAQKQVKKD